MHDKELELFFSASCCFNEADKRGNISWSMNASEDSEYVPGAGVSGGGQVTKLAVSASGGAASRLVDSHDCWGCKEGGNECHQY